MVDLVAGGQAILSNLRKALLRVRYFEPSINVSGDIPGYRYEMSASRDYNVAIGEIDSVSAMRKFRDAETVVRDSIKVALVGASLGGKRHIIRHDVLGYWYCLCVTAVGRGSGDKLV